jgi:hypothetical protein
MTPIEERDRDFRIKVNQMISFPFELRTEFYNYWSEKNKSGTKMRFELERTWDLSRRLHRWANTHFWSKTIQNSAQKITPQIEEKSPIKEIQELDQLLSIYAKHPTSIRFVEFGKWYEYLKAEKLMKVFTVGEVNELRSIYNDNQQCRCACVQLTFDGYVRGGFTFNKIMEMRQKLV